MSHLMVSTVLLYYPAANLSCGSCANATCIVHTFRFDGWEKFATRIALGENVEGHHGNALAEVF